MITIIDYGAGNVKSVQNMLKKIGVASILTKDVTEIENATKLILPGVGHFDYGMQQLKQSGLIDALNKKVMEEKTPLLGICLGAQMLGNKSEEGTEKGLGWIDMDIVKFDATLLPPHLKIPHMNWNEINIKKSSPILNDLNNESRFYFVHSYHMKPKHNEDILCTSNYGYEFVSGVQKDNIWGMQFHPEKSHKFGMQLLTNFAAL
jgi:imidazole glycerol-phosphate synthase subunit HisH